MRPIKVEFQAFGPYAGCETVDFEDLASKGLFLICGKTGIGKTMIIDAMTFALFGKSSGSGRDDFESMRCTRADFKTSTVVSFEFEHNDEIYRFQRRLDRKTKNLSESRDVSVRDEEGNWRTLFENAKKDDVNKKAEEIIGLTYDQFRQVIVLPQGQFEKLLTSDSNEKEKILTSIFGVDKWRRIAECFLEDAVARNDELAGIRDRIRTSLEDEECESIEDLRTGIRERKKHLDEMKKDYAEAGHDDRIKELQELLKVSGRLADLRDDLDNRTREENEAIEDLKKKEEAAETAEKKLKAHLEKAEEIEKTSEKKVIFEGKRNDYLGIDAALETLESLKNKKKAADRDKTLAEETAKTRSEELVAARKEYEKLDGEHKSLMDGYIAGITGELARELIDGQPCPVCGSTDHPDKARVSAESISKEDVERKKKAAESKYEEVEVAVQKQEKATADLEKKKNVSTDLESQVRVSEAKLEELKKNLVEGIETAEDLEKEIKALADSISSYEKNRNTLETAEKKAREDLALAKEKVKTTQNERESADRSLKKALAEMEGKRIQPEEDIRTKLDEHLESVKDHSTRVGIIEEDIKRLENKADALETEGEGLEDKIRVAEADVAFGKKLRGDSGLGLQRYVLGIMFSSVVAEANRMLEMVHGGRYRLFRTDDKGKGNKRGLELKVHDRNSEEHDGRFVGTLSGGEKFLAALALSIGMANVARKSGIGIDALFIDEGFGTLDEDSIGDAMSVLGRIQETNGIVGIISHMQILRDNIPTKLRVEGGAEGSHIIREIG